DAVAHGGRLLDLLEADRVLREARDGQQTRDGTEADDQVVVGDLELLVVLERHHHGVLGAADLGHRPRDDLGAGEDLPQRREDVARIDAAGTDLGEEGSVRHVRTRVDDRDRDLRTEGLAQLGCGRQTDGTASEDEDVGLAAEGISHTHRLELRGPGHKRDHRSDRRAQGTRSSRSSAIPSRMSCSLVRAETTPAASETRATMRDQISAPAPMTSMRPGWMTFLSDRSARLSDSRVRQMPPTSSIVSDAPWVMSGR